MNYAATENSRRCERSAAIQLIKNTFINRNIWIAALRSQRHVLNLVTDQVPLLLHAKLYRFVAKIQQNRKKSRLKTIYIVKILSDDLNRSGWI